MDPIPIARPLLGEREAEAAARVVRSGWVLQGPEVAAFEQAFAAFTAAPFACAVSSGTAALHLGLLALGVGPGDEVITVSHSYIATANSIRLCGATPVFVDIDETFNIDTRELEAAIGPRTKAILAVHQMGMPCDLSRILEIAERTGLRVVEDAACAAGSEISWQERWERVGRPRGDLATFSFHPRKLITTGDGGMVTTAHAEIDETVRLLRQHGMATPGAPATRLAFNYRLTDIQAAIGRIQLERLPAMVEERRALADRYRALLASLPAVTPPVQPAWARSNWQSYCVRLPETSDLVRVMATMSATGITTRPGIMNAHEEPAYRDHPRPHRLTRSEAARARGLMLPIYPGLDPGSQERVVRSLAAALDP